MQTSDAVAVSFYQRSMEILETAGIPFLVGGAYALRAHSGIVRETKDFDLMLRRKDVFAALEVFRQAGFRAELAFPHWIAKVFNEDLFIDLIYNSGNGLCPVDDEWFSNSLEGEVLGRKVNLCPPEEMIWQKGYIMERERFDGADIAHLIKFCGASLDWERLVRRFETDGAVLLAHLLLVRFIYPSEPELVPDWLIESLQYTAVERPRTGRKTCNGTVLSRAQYLPDVQEWGYGDARVERGSLSDEELRVWTAAIEPPRDAG